MSIVHPCLRIALSTSANLFVSEIIASSCSIPRGSVLGRCWRCIVGCMFVGDKQLLIEQIGLDDEDELKLMSKFCIDGFYGSARDKEESFLSRWEIDSAFIVNCCIMHKLLANNVHIMCCRVQKIERHEARCDAKGPITCECLTSFLKLMLWLYYFRTHNLTISLCTHA